MVWIGRWVAALAMSSYTGGVVSALPTDQFSGNVSHAFADFPPLPIEPRQNNPTGKDVELRILSLGASIMTGAGSSQGSGLRKWIRMALRFDGWNVNMVGTHTTGKDMKDNNHQAVIGAVIRDMNGFLKTGAPYKANIVIINVGTNNAFGNRDMDTAEQDMSDFLWAIYRTEGMADTCVILSTILPGENNDPGRQVDRTLLNGKYRSLVKYHNREGRCMYLADMEPYGEGATFIDQSDPTLWSDHPQVHPTDAGHKRVAYIFYAAIRRALDAGKVKKAPDLPEATTGCPKKYGNGISAGDNTQKGSGFGDGTYTHSSEIKGVVLELTSEWNRDQWRFARLFNSQYDDLLGWYTAENDPDDHRFGVWKNSADGQGKFTAIDEMKIPAESHCLPTGLRFIDMNGDGLSDLVCVLADGGLVLSINNGDGSGRRPPTFKYHGSIKTSEGKRDRVRLADIDGDGRGDLGIVNDDGTVTFWRNGGTSDKTEFWQPLGVRVKNLNPSFEVTGIRGRQFVDLNGDGRADYLCMRDDGRTDFWTNHRSCVKGKGGDGLNVSWNRASGLGNSGFTHQGIPSYQKLHDDRETDFMERIRFAKIYGTKPHFGSLGVLDYVFIEREELAKDKFVFRFHAWKNTGDGGTKALADGNKYCNMVGHKDGREDYVWAWSTGKMNIYPNAGKKFISGGEGYWDPTELMWTPPQDLDRRDLHLADWDGDGDCDIIWTNPENGKVRVWLNDYPTKQVWAGAFREISTAALPLACSEKRGIGINDLAVRFADLTGNGRADYLCINPKGKVVGFLQETNGAWTKVPQIKSAEDADRANLRWADVNGDGKDDMIWPDKFEGDGRVWYNRGIVPDPSANTGSTFHWERIANPVYNSGVAGTCVFYPDLDGNGRADSHTVLGTLTNIATTHYNPSCNGIDDVTGDDPEGVIDPKLPVQPGNIIGQPGPGEEDDPRNPIDKSLACKEQGKLDNRYWRSVTCTNKWIEDASDPASIDRWNGIDVSGSWLSTLEWMDCRSRSGLSNDNFTDKVSDYFNGPHQFKCDIWTSGVCSGKALRCEDVNNPTGYFILNSFMNIRQIHWDLYGAIGEAVTFTKDTAMVQDFGILQDQKDLDFNVMLDVVLIIFSLVAGPLWGGVVSTAGNVVKDEVKDMVSNGISLAKDVYAAKANDNNDLGILIKSAMIDMAESWQKSIVDQNTAVWKGDRKSVQWISALIADAKMLEPSTIGVDTLKELAKKAIAAQLIPLIWSLSPDDLYPVIIREETPCVKEAKEPWPTDGAVYMSSKAYEQRICNPSNDQVSYWLVAPAHPDSACSTVLQTGQKICDPLQLPPGYDHLLNSTYPINAKEVVLGSIQTWQKNGNKNGEAFTWNDNFIDEVTSQNFMAPGVFRIPVCSFKEATANWQIAKGNERWPNFPCNK